jgi:hypothetical protein
MDSDELIISDEWGGLNTRQISLASLRTNLPWAQSGLVNFPINKIYPLDQSFFITVPFDTLYTAICGTRKSLEAARIADTFEGFWCEAETTEVWWR